MRPDHIAELLHPFLSDDRGLTADDLDHILTYIDLLLRWNARLNLTAVRGPEEIVTRHFGESLFAARHLFPGGRAALQGRVRAAREHGALAPEAISLADLGSGAGFPGLPIKLWARDIFLTLIESNHKKAAFLREVIRTITLTNVNVFPARAEALADVSFDVVTLRAVERFDTILPIAASLVAPGGRLALLIASSQLPQAHLRLPAFAWSEPVPIPLSRSRSLLVGHRADGPQALRPNQ